MILKIYFALVISFICYTAFSTYGDYKACSEIGGSLVRGVFGFYCMVGGELK